MNKTQFYSLSSALLASTALASAASAGTIVRFDQEVQAAAPGTAAVFNTSPVNIANTLFSTTASTANTVVFGSGNDRANFGIKYANIYTGTTKWSTEFTISGARFVQASEQLANVQLLTVGTSNGTVTGFRTGDTHCATATALVDLFIINDCGSTTSVGVSTLSTTNIGALVFTGVTFNNASALATAGSSITLTGRVYNPSNPTQTFEAASSGTIVTSRAPFTVTVSTGGDAISNASTTPTAFTNLSTSNLGANNPLSLQLANVLFASAAAVDATLTTNVAITSVGTTAITVASSLLSASAVSRVYLNSAAAQQSVTAAAYSAGQVTFTLNAAGVGALANNSFNIVAVFNGTDAIPETSAAPGTISVAFPASNGVAGFPQGLATASGNIAAVSQGGFRTEVNTFNSSNNGAFKSYLRVHNNGNAAGTVTITVYNDAHTSGAAVGTPFTTASIAANGTLQLSAEDIETGAAIAEADRTGNYTLKITGPILGYVQHFLFDGNFVADLTSFRNAVP